VTLRVPFVDFAARVRALRPEIDEALGRVLDSGWFILGPEVEAFERELASVLGVGFAVAVGNGTDALQIALMGLGVGPGDEVVTSPLTAAFTGLAILAVGARPVFADVDPVTLTMAPDTFTRAITQRTKAVIPVHLYGHPADLDPIVVEAGQRGIAVVEDACQAHGARYKGRAVGTLGKAAALSFYPTKNLGAFGDGGALVTTDGLLAERFRQIRNGGQKDRYHHEVVGINSRLDEIQAALLRVGLRHFGAWTARRRELAARYTRGLVGLGLTLPQEQEWAEGVHHLYVVRHPAREAVMSRLTEAGVGCLIHYPVPLHLQRAFASLGGKEGMLPVAEAACGTIFSLPLYPELTDAQADRVIAATREALESSRKGGLS
jgi:dTDP-4-amino-4,6-dideoxygalactose transaminase